MPKRVRKRTLRIAVIAILVVAFVPLAAQPAAAWTPQQVYRFYNPGTGTHFYTASDAEVADVQAKYPTTFLYEGPAYVTFTDDFDAEPDPAIMPLYRFYNRQNRSHFYTISEVEKANVMNKWPTVYAYEGVAYEVYGSMTPMFGPGLMPVHRFYNKANGSHFYTISDYEKTLVRMLHSDVYTYEGIAFYASPYWFS